MKKLNSKLAVLCFAGMVGSQISPLGATAILSMLNAEAVAIYSVANRMIQFTSLLIAVIALIAVFRQNVILTYAACGVEAAVILLCLIAPAAVMRWWVGIDSIVESGAGYLRLSAVFLLVASVGCVLFRVIVKESSLMTYLLITGVGVLLSLVMPYIFVVVMRTGVTGLGSANIVQPVIAIMPLLMLNPERQSGTGENKEILQEQ